MNHKNILVEIAGKVFNMDERLVFKLTDGVLNIMNKIKECCELEDVTGLLTNIWLLCDKINQWPVKEK